MTEAKVESPRPATLFMHHRDEIIARWSEKIRNVSNSNYQQLTLEEVSDWLSQDLTLIITILDRGINHASEALLKEIAHHHLEAGFAIYEVTKGILLFKEIAIPLIRSSYSDGSPLIFKTISQLDTCLCQLINQFEYTYVELMHQQLSDDSNRRLAESESLRRTLTALLQKLTLDEVLEIVCSEACRLTGATGSSILLLDEEGWLRVTISIGTPLPILDRLPVMDSLAGESIRRGIPLIANGSEGDSQAYRLNPDLQSLLVVPLRANEVSIGVLDVINKVGGFTKDDIRIMSLYADQAAIAIENARLHEQAGRLAVVEERQRIARELHDSVTQSLYSASLYVNAAEMALSKGKDDVAAENLRELRSMTREAMLDMRLLIFELHPPILETEGLVTALQTRLESVEARSGIQAEFNVIGEQRLPLSVELELYRIAQEALTNVVKHAKAKQVSVNMKFDEDHFRMKIWDNGVGFDSKKTDQSGGRGLSGIQERVERINGQLRVESAPGKGTTLGVTVDI